MRYVVIQWLRPKKQLDQRGFGGVEAFLILVIVFIVGFTGWIVWYTTSNTKKLLSADKSTVPSYTKKSSILPDNANNATPVKTDAATALALKALDAIVKEDWATVYSLSSSDVTSSTTKAKFIAELRSGSSPKVISASLSGSSKTDKAAGYTFWSHPITVTTRNADGTKRTYTSTIHLVMESGKWRLIGTDTPK